LYIFSQSFENPSTKISIFSPLCLIYIPPNIFPMIYTYTYILYILFFF
jgi:hypothetical protein